MSLDIDEFRHYADRFDIPEDQKTDLIQTVWNTMQSAEDRAFSNDPMQQVISSRDDKNALAGPLVLNFEKAATDDDTFRLAENNPNDDENAHD